MKAPNEVIALTVQTYNALPATCRKTINGRQHAKVGSRFVAVHFTKPSK